MKVLIVRLSSIGDVIQGIPCLVALKESFPEWEISWLVEETSAPILENHPCLHKLFVVERKWRSQRGGFSKKLKGMNQLFQTLKSIRAEKFDLAIDLQGLLKSGFWIWLSGAPRRIGHQKTREFAHWFLNEYVSDRPVFDPEFPLIQRYLEPAGYLGANLSKGRYRLPEPSQETLGEVNHLLKSSPSNLPKIAFCPWSAWKTKNWPLDRWLQLGMNLQSKFQILIIGSQSEQSQASLFEQRIPGSLNLAGKTSLPQLAAIFAQCLMVIGPDSGPVHLANAVDKPTILMLFGSTSWKRSGPLGNRHRTLSTQLDCQPCFERICPLQHLHCQKQISVEQVLQEIEKISVGF